MRVRKAVFPAAGWGTRFLPATKAQPKEMLPLVDKPIIQYAVEEAVAAGIEQVIIVTSSQKRAIEDHFDLSYELEHLLEEKGDIEMLRQVRAHQRPGPGGVRPPEGAARASGHAVLMAKDLIGHEPFAVILPDDVVVGDRPCIGQLIHAYQQTHGSVVAVMEVPPEETSRYGVIASRADRGPARPRAAAPGHRLVEKPDPADAPSNLAIIGRYVLTPKIFDKLEQTQRGAGGEIQLTDAIQALMEEQQVYAYEFEGTRYDAGTTMGWLKASVELALQRPELAREFRRLPRRPRSSDRGRPRRRVGYHAAGSAPTTWGARAHVEGHVWRRSGRSLAAAIGWSSCSARAAWPPSTGPSTPSSAATSPSSCSAPSTCAIRTSRSRFRQEAQNAASLNHPNIVSRLRLRRGPVRAVHRHGARRRRGPRHDPPPERRAAARARPRASRPPWPARSPPPTRAASSTAT